jgi:hypothetical protein
MKNNPKFLIAFLFIFLILSCVVLADNFEKNPVPISPGRDLGIAVVEHSCPTFSWSGVERATAYRIAIFEAETGDVVSYEDMITTAEPLMSKEIPGRALSWTPSADEGLRTGGQYTWYVQAVYSYGHALGAWSKGKTFKVELTVRLAGIRERLRETLKEYGVGDDIINGTLQDLDSNVKEVNLKGEFSSNNNLAIVKPQYHETDSNTWLGLNAGNLTMTGTSNTLIGSEAGNDITEGSDNTFIGVNSGHKITSGGSNTFIGRSSGASSIDAEQNTFVGFGAGCWAEGSYNVFLGYGAGGYECGDNKLYIANSTATPPLIYGEFDNNIVAVNGKLGVGTQSPATDIEIKKSGSATLKITNTGGATFKMTAGLSNIQIGAITNHGIKYLAGGSWKMLLNPNGNLYMSDGGSYDGTWNNASSRELKENIETINSEEAFDTLENLEPVKYNYKKDKAELHAGFIAEDVPELVATKGRKNLSTMDIVAVLTKVVKEQQKTINDLKERIAKIEKK